MRNAPRDRAWRTRKQRHDQRLAHVKGRALKSRGHGRRIRGGASPDAVRVGWGLWGCNPSARLPGPGGGGALSVLVLAKLYLRTAICFLCSWVASLYRRHRKESTVHPALELRSYQRALVIHNRSRYIATAPPSSFHTVGGALAGLLPLRHMGGRAHALLSFTCVDRRPRGP